MSDDLEHHFVLDDRLWSVVLPRKPVFRLHLIIVVKDQSKRTFSDLDDGYDLFSNNGSARMGQHADQFRQHVVLKFTDEDESPYTVMARDRRWAADTTDEWTAQCDLLRTMLSHTARPSPSEAPTPT